MLSAREPRTTGAESGFALPVVLAVLAVLGLLAAATVTFATHSIDRSQRDRDAARALAAADAGLDAAAYRMNKGLVGSQVSGMFGFATKLIAEAKCVSISASVLTLVAANVNGQCPASSGDAEQVDGAATSGGSWLPASYSYVVKTDIDVNNLSVQRPVVSTGTVGDVSERVMATLTLQLDASGNLLNVFKRSGYEQCTSAPTTSDPFSGCPS